MECYSFFNFPKTHFVFPFVVVLYRLVTLQEIAKIPVPRVKLGIRSIQRRETFVVVSTVENSVISLKPAPNLVMIRHVTSAERRVTLPETVPKSLKKKWRYIIGDDDDDMTMTHGGFGATFAVGAGVSPPWI